MEIPIYIVDAFADAPFDGSSVAVCLSQSPLSTAEMARIAGETGQFSTAFVSLEAGRVGLRWFAGDTEKSLGGNGTLAAAHVLFTLGLASTGDSVRFQTVAGDLFAWQEGTGYSVDLPFVELQSVPTSAVIAQHFAGDEVWFSGETAEFLVIELAFESGVRAIEQVPAELWNWREKSLVVTAPGVSTDADYVVREFGPAEQRGSAALHCALGPYWAAKLGKSQVKAKKLSRRGGEIGVELVGERVHLQGDAFMTIRGTLGF